MLRLTSDVFNAEGLNVVDLATVEGAVPLLDQVLNTPDVYRFCRPDSDSDVYDVTYLAPQTTNRAAPVLDKRLKRMSIVPYIMTQYTLPSGRPPRTSKSCLDLIVDMEDETLAARVLDVSPFRQLVENYRYWKTYQWLYGMLMLIHIVYMVVYTVYVLPDSGVIVEVYNASSRRSCRSLPTSDLFGLFLIWPCLVLAFLIYYAAVSSDFRYHHVHGFNSLN